MILIIDCIYLGASKMLLFNLKMNVGRSKRHCLLMLTFLVKSISKNLLIRQSEIHVFLTSNNHAIVSELVNSQNFSSLFSLSQKGMTIRFCKLKQCFIRGRVFSLPCLIWWWVLGFQDWCDWYCVARLQGRLSLAVGPCWQTINHWWLCQEWLIIRPRCWLIGQCGGFSAGLIRLHRFPMMYSISAEVAPRLCHEDMIRWISTSCWNICTPH